MIISPDVVEVIDRPEFRDASLQHHGQHVDEEVGMATQDQVGILTQTNKPDSKYKHTHGWEGEMVK